MKTTTEFANSGVQPGRARSPLRATERLLATWLLVTSVALVAAPASPATNDLTSAIQRGLFEEEANQNLGAAIQAYQTVASQFDKDRKLAATAIFRLGECYRKQGNTNDAALQYERILREFSDQPTLVTLSRQNLAALGSAPAATPAAPMLSEAARQEQKRLLEEELKVVQTQLETQRRQYEAGVIGRDAIFPTEREVLKLKRQLAALDAGQVAPIGATESAASASAMAETERLTLENELGELKGLSKDKLRIAIQQNYPNPVLTSLMQKLTEAEQNLAALQKEYGPEHAEVVKAKAQLDAINKQVDAQVEGAFRGLEMKRDIAAKVAKGFQAQMTPVPPQGKERAPTAAAPASFTEADEIRRIQALIKDSPDLINAPDRKGETLLQAAAAKGKLAVVKLLLDNGAAVDGLQQPGLTALHYAAANGHKAVVDLLLSKGAKADAQTANGTTPLHLAARKGYEAVARALLAAGAPVNAQAKGYEKVENEDLQYTNNSGPTSIHLAAVGGYASLIELLLAKGAEVNAVDSSDRTPLSYAVEKRYQPVVQLLVAAHANPNAGAYNLPLTEAAYQGDIPTLKLLLASGADPNINTNLGGDFRGVQGMPYQGGKATPLAAAVSRQHPDAVAELIRAKADPNGSATDGTPLIIVALSDPPTLEALLEGGADPNRPMPESMANPSPGMPPRYQVGASPLYQAVSEAKQPAVELLLAHHADVNWTNQTGWTALHSAAANGQKTIAGLLLKAGAGVNAQNSDGETPLYCAVRAGQRDLAALLLANHADPNAKRNGGWTPLHLAVGDGKQELAELLLANKADPNAKDNTGQTPLHFAIGKGKQELAELLLTNKADPNERDNQGRTPLDLAKSPAQSPRPGMPIAVTPYPILPPGYAYPAGVTPGPAPKSQTMADLLRRHGALDDLPHLDQIGVRRSATGFSDTLFTKGAQDWSQFTLLELIAVQYSLLAASPNDGGGESYYLYTFFETFKRLPYPDLAHLHISRPAPDLKRWQDQVVDLSRVLATGDCSKDVRLRWGDVVEIPEADHPLNESWPGFSVQELANLKKCLTRQVEIVVKGQTTKIILAPQILNVGQESGATNAAAPRVVGTPAPRVIARTPFWLRPVLLQSKLVLISSDLARVKVTRSDPASGQKREWVVDCSKGGDSAPNLWLQDGDRIEVPEKTYSSAAQPEEGLLGLNTGARPSSGAATSASGVALEPPGMSSQSGLAAPEDGRTPAPQLPTRALRVPAVQATPADETPQKVAGQYLDVGGVRYSPKTDDPDLLNAGYHKDRSAKTRTAEFWEPRATSELSGRAANAVWTGTDMVVFGGEGMGTSFDNGARYCLAEDTWAMLPEKGAPSSRTGHAMVWTGKEVIVWGGFGGIWGTNTNRNDGARYNPSTDTWKPVSTKNAPAARFDFSAVWTGKEMLVWGGYTDNHSRYQGAHADAYLNTGGRYDPATDIWRPLNLSGAPSRRSFNSMVWTGKEMIVWGGGNASKVLGDGARYNPTGNFWKPVSTDGAPSPRYGHVSVWTGQEMIVWGGSSREASTPSDYFENGARYNPETDTWKPISTIEAPKGRVSVAAVWTGTEMVLWGGVNDAQAGGVNDSARYVGTGARYNPATDTWTEITTRGAPSPRLTSVVWTGDGLLTFGGYDGSHLNDAWFYSPRRTLYPYAKQ